MKNYIIVWASCVLVVIGLLNAQSVKVYHEQGFQDELLYLHVMENYNYNPSWILEWEKQKFNTNNVLLNFGSVEIHDLYNDIRILINEPLDSNWTFLGDYTMYATHFVNEEINTLFLGLERNLFSGINVYMQFQPEFDKEFIDGRIGAAWYNCKKTNYVRLALQFDQFVYEDKNEYKGNAKQQPLGLNWNIRLGNDKWSFYTEGIYTDGFIWQYPDSAKSLGLKSHSGLTNQAIAHAYYFLNTDVFFRLEMSLYRYKEKKGYYFPGSDYDLSNNIRSFQLLYSQYLSPGWRIRISGRYVNQDASAFGPVSYQYERNEILPALWLDYQIGRQTIELAVMESFYEWESRSANMNYNFSKESNIEKVKLGWSYQFENKSRLQLSLSHVFSIFGFGGFNLNYLMFF